MNKIEFEDLDSIKSHQISVFCKRIQSESKDGKIWVYIAFWVTIFMTLFLEA